MKDSTNRVTSERKMKAVQWSISIVIPAYNSEGSLPGVAQRLKTVLDSFASDYELILVDDASKDGTWSTIRKLSRDNPWIRGVRLMRNFGQHNASLCGIRLARYELIITMDDDLQHPPEEIPKLLRALQPDTDVVYGTPSAEQHGLWRNLASQATKIALQASMGAPIARKAGAFRIFRTDLRKAFAGYDGPYVSIDVLLTWATVRFNSVEVRHDARQSGTSNYTFLKLVRHSLNMITGFSVWPLQLASLIGFVFTVFGTITLAFVFGHYLIYGGLVPGFSFLASTIAIFSGAQLFALGIMGEYLARMHLRSMQKPVYAVREIVELALHDGVVEHSSVRA